MITKQEAARRIAAREANHKKSARAADRIQTQARRTVATGRTIVRGKQVDLMSQFDASNPPAQPAAQEKLAEVAQALGVDDPTDAQALQLAFASLLEAAGLDTGNGSPESTEVVEDPNHHDSRVIDPRVVNRADVERGRRIMAGTERESKAIDRAAVERGKRAFKGGR